MAKRRGNGEGNIRKRKDGRWEGRYTAGTDPDTGKPIGRNVLGKTQAEVREKLKAAIKQAELVDIRKYENYTLAQWLRTWYETYAVPNVRESTALYYRNFIENHIVPDIGKTPLKRLTALDLQKFYNRLTKNGRFKRYESTANAGLSNKTVRGIHMLLHCALGQAVKERILPYNPADGCHIPPKEKKEMQVLPTEKIGAYLQAAKANGVLPIFYLELTSGLRRGELAALLWTDLDADACTISVTKTVNRMSGELKVQPPKTPKSIRTVKIPQRTVDLLKEEHAKHPDNPYMFPSPVTGTMYDPSALRRIHKRLLKQVGLEQNIRFHDLRHTFTTVMLQNGVDPKTLSQMLGHESTSFTLDVYSHVTDQMQNAAAEKMGAFMEQAM